MEKTTEKPVGKVHDRKTRRALQKRAREQKKVLEQVTGMACLLLEDAEKAKTWVLTPSDYFFNKSPFEMVLLGDGEAVLELLKERTRQVMENLYTEAVERKNDAG